MHCTRTGRVYRLQLIPINLNLDEETISAVLASPIQHHALKRVFAHYVLSRFDMAVCRVSVSWDLLSETDHVDTLRELAVFDLTCTLDVHDVNPQRRAKYEARKKTGRCHRVATCGSLALYTLLQAGEREA